MTDSPLDLDALSAESFDVLKYPKGYLDIACVLLEQRHALIEELRVVRKMLLGEYCKAEELIVELRATRAERDALHVNHDAWDEAIARTERAQADLENERQKVINLTGELAVANDHLDEVIARAERAEAAIADHDECTWSRRAWPTKARLERRAQLQAKAYRTLGTWDLVEDLIDAEAERDEARRALARVEARCAHWASLEVDGDMLLSDVAAVIRADMRGPVVMGWTESSDE